MMVSDILHYNTHNIVADSHLPYPLESFRSSPPRKGLWDFLMLRCSGDGAPGIKEHRHLTKVDGSAEEKKMASVAVQAAAKLIRGGRAPKPY